MSRGELNTVAPTGVAIGDKGGVPMPATGPGAPPGAATAVGMLGAGVGTAGRGGGGGRPAGGPTPTAPDSNCRRWEPDGDAGAAGVVGPGTTWTLVKGVLCVCVFVCVCACVCVCVEKGR